MKRIPQIENPMKNIFALAAVLVIPALVSAQEIHIYGGYNGSNVSKAGEEAWVGKAGYQFGADLMLGNQWFVKPGIEFLVRNVNYSYAGTAPDGTIIGTDQEFQYTSRSLRVPIMLGVHLMDPSDEPAANVYIMAGPSAIMNLNADLNNNALNVETNGTQWQIGFGAGVELGFLFAEGGYDIAMSNVFKGNNFQTNPKVNFLHINAGVRLRLAR
jgi:hypothetical protein